MSDHLIKYGFDPIALVDKMVRQGLVRRAFPPAGAKETVRKMVELGLVSVPDPVKQAAAAKAVATEKHKKTNTVCMDRLRAERQGEDTSKFPPRVRRRKMERIENHGS